MANEHNLKPFKKGYDPRRGNKPKGAKHLTTHIQELLNSGQVCYDLSGSQALTDRPIKAIISVLIDKAIQGDYRAIELLFKFGYRNADEDSGPGEIIITTRKHRHEDSYVPEITSEQAEELLRLRAKRKTINEIDSLNSPE